MKEKKQNFGKHYKEINCFIKSKENNINKCTVYFHKEYWNNPIVNNIYIKIKKEIREVCLKETDFLLSHEKRSMEWESPKHFIINESNKVEETVEKVHFLTKVGVFASVLSLVISITSLIYQIIS